MVEKWFGEIPSGPHVPPIDAPPAYLTEEKRVLLEDRVQLPRLYMAWLTPAAYEPGDAALTALADVLAGGKNARLHKRLVYDLQIAQDVTAFQHANQLSSAFYIIATARPGVSLQQIQDVVQEELDRLRVEPPTERELERAVNQYASSFLNQLQQVGGFGGKADQLNRYYFYTQNPDYFDEDLSRFKALSPEDLLAATRAFLQDDGRVILGVVPEGQQDLAPQLVSSGE